VRGYAHQIFSFAIDHGYTTVNPFAGVKKFRERSSEENGDISRPATLPAFRLASFSIEREILNLSGMEVADHIGKSRKDLFRCR